MLGRRKQSSRADQKDASEEDSAYNLQNLSNSALERLQLHMHLQTLQNPFSFHNNLNPLQQKMIQTLNSMNEINQETLLHQPLSHDYSPLSNLKSENSMNGFSSSEIMDQNPGINQMNSGFTQAELDDLINSNHQTSEINNCFKEMDHGPSTKENLAWWSSNEFDATSAWDSTAMINHDHQSGGVYQDYVVAGGYGDMV